MAETETLYSARQLADELGLTLQMLSIYAKCYSQKTKQQISKKGRLGRHFTEAQREVIKNAREMVQQNTGITVDEAMRKALVFDAAAIETPTGLEEGTQVDLDRLKTAFSEALRQEVTLPLVAEIQALRLEVAELKQDKNLQPPPQIKNRHEVEAIADRQHSLLVRLALWLEQRFRSS
jgi:FtsZ-binding cell division protein ZapB